MLKELKVTNIYIICGHTDMRKSIDGLAAIGIHIFNEDVYPIQRFEIHFRSCGLTGNLDLSDSTDNFFIDLYHNHISSCNIGSNFNRILGL